MTCSFALPFETLPAPLDQGNSPLLTQCAIRYASTLSLTVPDLGDDKKNRSLEQLVVDFAARLARYAESVG